MAKKKVVKKSTKKKATKKSAPRKKTVAGSDRRSRSAKKTARRKKKAKKTVKKAAVANSDPQVQAGPLNDDGQRLLIASWGDSCEHQAEVTMGDADAVQEFVSVVAEATGAGTRRIGGLVRHAVESMDRMLAEPSRTGGNQAAEILAIADDSELFRGAAGGESFITFAVGDHRENWPVESRAVRDWLSKEYYQQTRRAPPSQALNEAIATLGARAQFEGEEHPVFVRVGELNGRIYVDLGRPDWKVVEISDSGVRLRSRSPVKFRRTRTMGELPTPKKGGTVDELRPLLNVADDDDWVMTIAWLVGAFRPHGPYAIDVAYGEQGTSKSTRTKFLRDLVDPRSPTIRSEPRSIQDLVVEASQSWILAYDNLSFVQDKLSDALCRIATGGGFGTRRLYSNDEEHVIDVSRPVMLNGIEELATRGDLLDRAIVHHLKVIPDSNRLPEKTLNERYDRMRGRVLGAIFEAISGALRNLPNTRVENPPRMADFANWVTAAEESLGWEPGTFIAAYRRNIEEARLVSLETSPVVSPLRIFMARLVMEGETSWQGTATDLLRYLEGYVGDVAKDRTTWPRNPQSLSNKLRRLAPTLRAIQMEIEFDRSSARDRTRLIRVTVPDDFRRPDHHSNPGPGEVPRA